MYNNMHKIKEIVALRKISSNMSSFVKLVQKVA